MVTRLINTGREILINKQKTMLSATALMIVLVAITKVVGFWKVHLMARFFGTPRELDIFWGASTIPDILYNVFMVGALSSALIPALSARMVKKGEKSLWKLFNWVFNLLVLAFIVFGILSVIFANPISEFMVNMGATKSTTPFTATEIEKMAMIMRILMISPLLLGISTIHESILNVYDRFVVPTLGPLFYNIAIIISMLVFVKGFDLGIYGLVIGVIVGSLIQVLIQLPLLRHLKIPYIWGINFKSKDLWKIITRSLPRVVGIAGDQIGVFVDRAIGLGLTIGSLSAFNYAMTLYVVPLQLFGSTIGRTSNPALSRDYAAGNMEGFKKTLIDAFQLAFFFSIPVTAIIIILRVPLVRIILGAGEFDWQATLTTGWILAFLGIGILPYVMISIATRAFYSMHNTVLPVVISMAENVVNIILAILFVNYFSHYKTVEFFYLANRNLSLQEHVFRLFTRSTGEGAFAVGGLGLSMSIAVVIWAAVLIYFLEKRVRFIWDPTFWAPFIEKMFFGFISASIMYIVYYFVDHSGWEIFNSSKVYGVALILTVCSGVGVSIYAFLCWIGRVKEMDSVVKMFKSAYEKFRVDPSAIDATPETTTLITDV
jgi:putative peptidoglycan lipid II flippase